MNWFKRMIVKWVREDWENASTGLTSMEANSLIKELKRKTDPNQPEIKRAETEITYKEMLRK